MSTIQEQTEDKIDWAKRDYEVMTERTPEKEKKGRDTELIRIKEQFYTDLRDAEKKSDYVQAFNNAKAGIINFLMRYEVIKTVRSDERVDMWIYRDGIFVNGAKSCIKEVCAFVYGHMNTYSKMKDVIDNIEPKTYIDADEFFKEKNPNLLCLQNGVLDIKEKKLLSYSSEYTFFTKIPINYNHIVDCPKIKKFMTEIVKPEDVPVLEEMFAFCLVREYWLHKAIVLTGKGRNGKGVLLNLLQRFLGNKNVSSLPLNALTTNNFAQSELFSKYANISDDLSNNDLENTGLFKSITGNGCLTADRKFKNSISFHNYAKIICACNQLPKTKDISDGFFDRWIIVDFPYRFYSVEEQNKLESKKGVKLADRDLINTLATREELSGLLNLSLVALERLMAKGCFSNNMSSEQVKALYKRKCNSLLAFIEDCVIEDREIFVSKQDFRLCYEKYCETFNLLSLSDVKIAWYLKQMNCVSEQKWANGMKLRYWVGIGVKGLECIDANGTGMYGLAQGWNFEKESNSLIKEHTSQGSHSYIDKYNINNKSTYVEVSNEFQKPCDGDENCDSLLNYGKIPTELAQPCDKTWEILDKLCQQGILMKTGKNEWRLVE